MRIYIPTLNRVPARQYTLRELGPYLIKQYKATLVCNAKDADKLDQGAHGAYSVEVCNAKGIAATRQWIIDNTTDNIVLMLDDDLASWSWRRDKADGTVGYLRATEGQRREGFKEFAKLFGQRKYSHGAIGHRLFANNRQRLDFNTRQLRALCYDADVLAKEKIKFRIPVMEDFDVQLQLLKRGYKSVQYNQLTQEQRGSNEAGGCSTYRTHKVQAAAAHELARLHPDCVKVVQKELTKGWGGEMGGIRTDVKVQWAKAIRAGLEYANAHR